MPASHNISSNRRTYNKLVANEMMEDFALRFTSRRARKWPYSRIANTALGIVSFMVLEAIGGAITLSYGFVNAAWAIVALIAVIFISGTPISYYAARYGVDIDLLSRGAGFGYAGSTIASLVYASFTFIFFALEAAIMSMALELLLGIPLYWLCHQCIDCVAAGESWNCLHQPLPGLEPASLDCPATDPSFLRLSSSGIERAGMVCL